MALLMLGWTVLVLSTVLGLIGRRESSLCSRDAPGSTRGGKTVSRVLASASTCGSADFSRRALCQSSVLCICAGRVICLAAAVHHMERSGAAFQWPAHAPGR